MKPIAVVFVALASFAGLYMTVSHLERELANQAVAVERRKTQCYAVRVGLESTRRNLLEANDERHRWGRTMFEGYMRDDWHLVNTCGSESLYVEGGCSADDLPCMLHALDWALVNTR